MGSMSRNLSRTLIKVLLKHELEAIRRFASLSVRITPFVAFEERGKELTVWHRFACAGKGIHSPNQAAKLKPAIEEFMQK